MSSWLSPFDYYSLFQLRESTLFPDGSSVEFRCDESDYFPGHQFAQEGNSSLTCHDGQWDSRIPYCRTTASNRANYSGIQTLLEDSTQCLKISKKKVSFSVLFTFSAVCLCFRCELFIYIFRYSLRSQCCNKETFWVIFKHCAYWIEFATVPPPPPSKQILCESLGFTKHVVTHFLFISVIKLEQD